MNTIMFKNIKTVIYQKETDSLKKSATINLEGIQIDFSENGYIKAYITIDPEDNEFLSNNINNNSSKKSTKSKKEKRTIKDNKIEKSKSIKETSKLEEAFPKATHVTTLTTALPVDVIEKLKAIATKHNVNKSRVVNKFLLEGKITSLNTKSHNTSVKPISFKVSSDAYKQVKKLAKDKNSSITMISRTIIESEISKF